MNESEAIRTLEDILTLSLNNKEAYELFRQYPELWSRINRLVKENQEVTRETNNC